jgi:hypothetical protein
MYEKCTKSKQLINVRKDAAIKTTFVLFLKNKSIPILTEYQESTVTQASPDPNNDQRRRLSSDELIALFVAFTTIGSVLFWGMTRSGLDLVAPSGRLSGGQWFGWTTGDQGRRTSGNRTPGERLGAGILDEGFGDETGQPFLTDRPADSRTTAPDRAPAEGGPARRSAPRQGTGPVVPVAPTTTGTDAAVRGSEAEAGSASPDSTAADSPASATAPADAPTLNVTREAIAFQDVPDDYWAKPYIDALSSRQLIEGFDDNTFKPNEPVNRAQLATLITQAFVLTPEKDAIAFSDLSEAEWAATAIDEAVTSGFMTGFPDQTFQPTTPVPRAQALTALVTGLNTQAAGNVQTVVERYADADKIPEWAVGKMAAATQSGIVVNYPDLNQLAPNQPATRAEVTAMIYQALVYQGRLEPIESAYVVKP